MPPAPVHVTGGAGGIVADGEQLAGLARAFGNVAGQALHSAWTLHGYLLEPGLIASAAFDPVGFADVQARLLDALDGPGGLSWVGARAGLLDGEVRAAAAAYETADRLAGGLRDQVLGLVELPPALATGARALAGGTPPLAAAQAAIARDPAAADDLVALLHVPALLRLAAGSVPDGRPVVHPLGEDTSPVGATPPRRLTDLLTDLAARNDDEHHATIDVRVITLADGSRRVVVDVTGTKSWTQGRTSDVTSLTTNERALVGEPTAYEHGVLAAMHRAGVRPTDRVMIVGHSEGGMVAVEAARDAVASGAFAVTHVVTAGSPIGMTVGALPRSVQVLALENERDLVPHLDGVANPDEPNVTTVSAAHGDRTVAGDHDIERSYVPLARDAELSDSTSVRTFLHGARDWFRGVRVRTHTFYITRRY